MSLAVQRTEYLNVSHYRHAPAEIIAADMLAACADGCQLPSRGICVLCHGGIGGN